jgi:quercetin dioxygenase-like cupin family protein
MKLLIVVFFLACAGLSHPAYAQAIDAVRVSPDRYRVLLDNPEVRVVEYVLQPGQRDEWHTHPAKASYVVTGGILRITLADGTSVLTEERQGTAQWMNTLGRHYATNVGRTPVRIVLVEVKNAAGMPVTPGTPVGPVRPVRPVTPAAPAAPAAPPYIASAASLDCVSRMAALPGQGTTMIVAARLQPGNPMPALPPGGPRRYTVSVVVDTVGRADPATLQVPADLDSISVNAIRTVLPAWNFTPARLGQCPVKQVVRLTFSR